MRYGPTSASLYMAAFHLSPYKKGFEKLLGKPIVYIENYLSSEGFIGYKTREHAKGMQLILNNNIFFEFVPFDDKEF